MSEVSFCGLMNGNIRLCKELSPSSKLIPNGDPYRLLMTPTKFAGAP